jgi:16S rRNA (guanine527-N7)-methyltransferase
VPDTDQRDSSPTLLRQVLLEARSAGFLGPGPIEPHLDHATGFVTLARRLSTGSAEPPRLLDLGSGGGLPGLVIALAWPTATLVLLDANERRTDFLRQSVRRLDLEDRVTVVHQRAETSGRDPEYRGTFDGVVVRSFGAPAVVAECSAPFLRLGGWLIVSEPPGSVEDGGGGDGGRRWPAPAVAQVGLEPGEFERGDFGYQVLYQRELCPERYPRRNGVPSKHPLF